MANLSAPHFTDDIAARQYLENLRWPFGADCPYCGSLGRAIASKTPGKYRCAETDCRKHFSVTVGTVFERSQIPLHKWLLAAYLLCSSEKRMSSYQLHHSLDVPHRSAWSIAHRLREAMRSGTFAAIGGAAGNQDRNDFAGNGHRPGQNQLWS